MLFGVCPFTLFVCTSQQLVYCNVLYCTKHQKPLLRCPAPHTLPEEHGTHQDPAKGVELVHCSTSRVKTTLLFLKLRFAYRTHPALQHP